MGVTDSYLNMEIEEADLLELAAYFDNIEYYLEMLGLTPGEQTDVRSCTNSSGTRFGMMLALKYWSNRDPFEATYRTLLLILLSLQKRDIAIRVFKYLSHKRKSIIYFNLYHMGGKFHFSCRLMEWTFYFRGL